MSNGSGLSRPDPHDPAAPVELVVVGGSAGSIDVLQCLVQRLSVDFAPAMAVVIHMPQNSAVMLHDLLSGANRPPMKLAEDKEPIAPGALYFAPPGYHLLVERERTFALSVDEPVHFSRPSIDVLFESAALAYGACGAGIILSGANSDGAAGLRAVAEAGGQTFVQDPSTAEVCLMPQAALQASPGSRVRSPQAIAEWLGSLRRAGTSAVS